MNSRKSPVMCFASIVLLFVGIGCGASTNMLSHSSSESGMSPSSSYLCGAIFRVIDMLGQRPDAELEKTAIRPLLEASEPIVYFAYLEWDAKSNRWGSKEWRFRCGPFSIEPRVAGFAPPGRPAGLSIMLQNDGGNVSMVRVLPALKCPNPNLREGDYCYGAVGWPGYFGKIVFYNGGWQVKEDLDDKPEQYIEWLDMRGVSVPTVPSKGD